MGHHAPILSTVTTQQSQDETSPHESSVLIVVPVYNHAATLPQVVKDCLMFCPDVLVVDDGSTDLPDPCLIEGKISNTQHPLYGLNILFERHKENKGKGAAILTAAQRARELLKTHIITIDADSQHFPGDIPLFVTALTTEPTTLFVGARDFNTENVPSSSRFGRSFSNFWYKLQTGETISDSQSGFRCYPLAILDRLLFTEVRYSFETEVLVRSAWAGFQVKDIPIEVHYPPADKRVSHFAPLMDNIRISLLNTRLTIRSILPIPQKKYESGHDGTIHALKPIESIATFLKANNTPFYLSLAAALGCFIGTLPLIGVHTLLIILLAGTFRLNKIMAVFTSNFCMPPFVPALCIEVGYFMRHGSFLTEISIQTLGYEALERIFEWVIGSLIVAPLLGALAGLTIFVVSKSVQYSLSRKEQRA